MMRADVNSDRGAVVCSNTAIAPRFTIGDGRRVGLSDGGEAS